MRVHLVALIPAVVVAFDDALVFPRSTLNGPCTGKDGVKGVCVPTHSCSHDNGTYIDNGCPGTPEDIKCCTKPSCSLAGLGVAVQSGDCRWTQDCGEGKKIVRNLCPGPDEYRCCVSSGGGGGGGPTANLTTTSLSTSVLPSSTGNLTSIATSLTSIDTTSSASHKPSSKTKKPTPTSKPKPKPTKTLGEKILAKAKEAKGIPYHWAGGNCKGKTGGGFDCSGLVSWAVCQVTGRDLFDEGLRVTRSMYCASEKRRKYKKVKWSKRRAGDAVFFGGKCDCQRNPGGIHHVGLMMNSGWDMWNALKTGTRIRHDNFEDWDESPCPYVIRFE